jgi:hypothetical protein
LKNPQTSGSPLKLYRAYDLGFKLQDGLAYHHRNPSKTPLETRPKVKPKKWLRSKTIMQIPNAEIADNNFIPAFYSRNIAVISMVIKRQLLVQLLKPNLQVPLCLAQNR